ncbi:MAG TPA: YbaK/EbsC family protein [Burkholderiales bacterium]|nr:YbaK/EbsC family protein [Burkholderiales bacterium]
MSIPEKLRNYMTEHRATWDVCEHARTASSTQTLRVTHIPAERLAKSVVLEDDDGYLMIVLPASGRVDLAAVNRMLNRNLRLASEPDVVRLFDDCDPGAIPAIGPAYGVRTMVDESLLMQPEIYFEAGDHTELIHMSCEKFMELMAGVPRGKFMVRH